MSMVHVSRGDLRKATEFLSDKAFRKADIARQKEVGVRKGLRTEVRAAEGDKLGSPLPFIMSLGAIDRYDSTIAVDGWDLGNFVLNPVMTFCHNTYAPTIGRWDNVRVEDDKLKGDGVFAIDANPLALMTEKLYRGRFMFACSVSFIPLEWEIAEDRDDGHSWMPPLNYLMQELTECSPCPVPGQPGALAEGQRSITEPFLKARAAGIDVKPYIEFLARSIDEFREPGDERKSFEEVWEQLREPKITSLPPPAAKEKTMERSILVIRLEANKEHIEQLKKELDKRARNIGAKVLDMRDGDGGAEAEDDEESMSRSVKDLGQHVKALSEQVKSFGGHGEAFGKHAEALGKHNEKLDAVCKDLGALVPDKDATKDAPENQERGGAGHKLSAANTKDHNIASEALARIGARHMDATSSTDDGDEDDKKKSAKDAEKRAAQEKEAADKKLAADTKARAEVLEKQVLGMQKSLDLLVQAATGKVK